MESSERLVTALQEWIETFMHRSMRHLLVYAREQGLSPSQVGALLQIHRHGACGVSSIGGHLGVTSPAVSHMLERLVSQELVVRSEDPRDRRAKQIVLTEKGRRVMQESIQARQEWLEGLARLMTPQEQDQVLAALKILTERSDRLEKQPGLVLDI